MTFFTLCGIIGSMVGPSDNANVNQQSRRDNANGLGIMGSIVGPSDNANINQQSGRDNAGINQKSGRCTIQ